MDTNKMIDLVLKRERGCKWNKDILSFTNMENAIEVFTNKHFNDILTFSNSINKKGFESNNGSYKLLGYVIAGRLMVTISFKETSVTIVGAGVVSKISPGIQSIKGNSKDVVEMLYHLTQKWSLVKKELVSSEKIMII